MDGDSPMKLTGAFYAGLLDGLLGVAGMMKLLVINYGSFPKIPCVKRTSKEITFVPVTQVATCQTLQTCQN